LREKVLAKIPALGWDTLLVYREKGYLDPLLDGFPEKNPVIDTFLATGFPRM
jgi:hypothetical protein